jgi:nucleotide-binding universal stress UspA family protein
MGRKDKTMKIIVAYDGSPAAASALDQAMALFHGRQATVVLLGALLPPATVSDLGERAFDIARQDAQAELDQAAQKVREKGFEAQTRLVEGDPRRVLEQVAGDEAPDLVVVGARGRSAVSRLLLGSVSTYAVHHLECPVLVVR